MEVILGGVGRVFFSFVSFQKKDFLPCTSYHHIIPVPGCWSSVSGGTNVMSPSERAVPCWCRSLCRHISRYKLYLCVWAGPGAAILPLQYIMFILWKSKMLRGPTTRSIASTAEFSMRRWERGRNTPAVSAGAAQHKMQIPNFSSLSSRRLFGIQPRRGNMWKEL